MAEHVLLNRAFERTADELLSKLSSAPPAGQVTRLWLFEDQPRRQALQSALAARGVQAHVYSAYKPLVHYFLEEVERAGLTAVHLTYPVHPACNPARFRLETYPLVALLPGIPVTFEGRAVESDGHNANTWYQVKLQYGEREEAHRVFAPNLIRDDFLGQPVCIPSAWLAQHPQGASPTHTPLASEYLQCYDAVMQAVVQHDWGKSEPYFDRLVIQAWLPGIERRLSVGHETISTTEALHEDLYFSLLEFFQHHAGRQPGSRGLQPGQIIPDIQLDQEGPARVQVFFEPASALQDEQAVRQRGPEPQEDILSALPGQAEPLSRSRIQAALLQFDGDYFAFTSRQHRAVAGIHHKGSKPAILISGAQHANETTGVVGALRAADALRHDAGGHFVLMPLENPDGYALHKFLRQHNPRHMHHAARYSALGDDIEYREHAPWFERRARNHAFAVSGAQLHLNLHGYPAHEWTRPCTGYLPRGFELWSIPKGFFLILRYKPAHETRARALLEHVTQSLAGNAALVDYNTRQLDTYRQHADAMPFEVLHGMPYLASAVDAQACDVTLITEFPDETIAGEDFIFGHTVQAQTAIAASRWWWAQA